MHLGQRVMAVQPGRLLLKDTSGKESVLPFGLCGAAWRPALHAGPLFRSPCLSLKVIDAVDAHI